MKYPLLFLLLLFVPALAIAQPGGDPLSGTRSGASTLDLLADMAASAPTRSASAPAAAGARKDSRERLLESLKQKEDAAAASAPMSSLRAEALAAMASSRIDAVSDRNRQPDESQPFEAPQTRALQQASTPDRIVVDEDSWVRATSRYIRENRGWLLGTVVLTLALGWAGSRLFVRSGRPTAKAPPPVVSRPTRRPRARR